MKYMVPLVAVFTLVTGSLLADTRVRRISVLTDQIVTVKTALGVATIIQVPDKPNSVVVGDMNAYKVEYLDTAITIKPLTSHSKSNLYIYTDYRRFNVQLVTGVESAADYVVYLDSPKAREPSKDRSTSEIRWTPIGNFMSNDAITMKVSRVGQTAKGLLLVDFTIKGIKSEPFKPEWIWLTQGGISHTIQGLILSSLSISPKSPIRGTLEILRSDVNEREPLRIEMRRKKMSFLTIPGVNGWRH